MKYYITLMSITGVIEEHALELVIDNDIKWDDFVNLTPVQTLLRERAAVKVLDITPEDMLNTGSVEETDDITLDEENE